MADEHVDFEPSSLSLAEAELLEDLAGRPVGEVLVGLMRGRFGSKDLRAIATVMKRREDPDFDPATLDGDMKVTGLLSSAVTGGMLADVMDNAVTGRPGG